MTRLGMISLHEKMKILTENIFGRKYTIKRESWWPDAGWFSIQHNLNSKQIYMNTFDKNHNMVVTGERIIDDNVVQIALTSMIDYIIIHV